MSSANDLHIWPPEDQADRRWLEELWQREWGGDIMVSRGHVYRLTDLHALVAKLRDERVGAATYRFDGVGGCELMSINATLGGHGIGSQLLGAVESEARAAGCQRVWMVTSNDNIDALRFYQRRGYRMTAVHSGAIDAARRIKPTIPRVSEDGIEIRDEIELAKDLE
ncbi:hypothetical protein GCM10025857_37820 [Alicyclobacillus contaminans]|uniref:GNAT family N-acetyltransferase n=1 Tax=Alicyclobacillus contaminans TaxID=392016 RepID=UPI000429ED00|nr:GNAT family N-acetyltransferase [Alicyclobacillus contaminans]GMA52425.1 hypothetical protein GCM10025857_37820 [Alicyclobacillus contaminans]